MERRAASSCGACPTRETCCADSAPADNGAASGIRLVGQAAGVFLAPLAATIVAAAVAPARHRTLVGTIALAAALAAVCLIARLAGKRGRSAP